MGAIAELLGELIDAPDTQPPPATPQQRRATVTEVWAMDTAVRGTPDTEVQATDMEARAMHMRPQATALELRGTATELAATGIA
jgi:hypothetical protein